MILQAYLQNDIADKYLRIDGQNISSKTHTGKHQIQ